MGIVMITMASPAKLAFAHALHQKTSGGVDLVLVQKTEKIPLKKRFARKHKMLKDGTIFKEAWNALLLHLSPEVRNTLAYFREPEVSFDHSQKNGPKILEVDSMNSEETHALLKKLAPDLLVVWGSKILKPHIIATAKQAINLHIGRCPHYRGTLANQHAVLSGDFSNIGATIHYIVPEVDAGDIISVVDADLSKQPKQLFKDLFDRALNTYLDIATRLYQGEKIVGIKQPSSVNKILRLDEWTPEIRYTIGKKVYEWEQGFSINKQEEPQTIIPDVSENLV